MNPNELVTVIGDFKDLIKIFGLALANYIPNITTEQHWELNKSALIADTVNNLESLFSSWGMEFENLFEVTLALARSSFKRSLSFSWVYRAKRAEKASDSSAREARGCACRL